MNREIKKAIGRFLIAWQRKDWAKMLKYTQLTWKDVYNHNAKWLESWFGLRELAKWEIIKTEIIGEACRDVYIEIDYGKGIKKIRARVICEAKPLEPSIKGNWGINPTSCLKEI